MTDVDPVQKGFATVLIWIVRIGLLAMAVTFVLYVSGAVESAQPVEGVSDNWHLEATEYRTVTDSAVGWHWIRDITDGATLAFSALVFFPVSVIVAVAIAAILYARHRIDRYAVVSALLAVVLLIAAMGIISPGQ